MPTGLELTAQRISARYYPENRRPYHNWTERTISVSKLVPYSAEDYALSLIEERDSVEKGDDVNPKFGFLGNAIATAALADMAAHENNVNVTLNICNNYCEGCASGMGLCTEQWSLTGHFDGIDAHPDGIVIVEHKAFTFNEAPGKTRDAMRQGCCYMSMAWAMVKTNGVERDLTFELGAYENGIGRRFTWPAGAEPLGVVVACAPSYACEARIELYPLRDCEEILAFYLSKARAVRDAYLARDISIARAWDQAHPAENIRPLAEVMAGKPLPDLAPLIEELAAVTRKLTPPPLPLDDREIDLLESRRAELRKLTLLKMADLGEKRVDIPGFRINRQTWPERVEPAEPERVIPAGQKLVVTPVKTKEIV